MRLLYGQPHAGNADWLRARFGQTHSIPIEAMPHTRALAGDHAAYLEYLAASWANHPTRSNTPEGRQADLDHFLRKAARPDLTEPLAVIRRPDGALLVVDGTHRAAIAHHHHLDTRITEESPAVWLKQTTRDRRHPRGIPYHSVHTPDGRTVVAGRRNDTWKRHQAITTRLEVLDLSRETIDLGANIGGATLLVPGAAVGVDHNPRHATAGLRLAAYLARPARFITHDLNTPPPEHLNTDDTIVYCFSLLAHLANPGPVRGLLARGAVVYIEEDHRTVSHLDKVADLFTTVRRIPTSSNRRLYECHP